jgi:putative transposase
MAEKFQKRYRTTSFRLQNWDYGNNAAYFITICCAGREHFFGKIENQQMILSNIGEIAQNEWLKTPEIRPDMNLTLGEFVVMPNHFHAIIVIGENEYNRCTDAMHRVSTFGPQRKNLASIMRGFKSSVTMNARQMKPNFAWQSKFHDHIIRNNTEYQRIANYIKNNPANWKNDKFHE